MEKQQIINFIQEQISLGNITKDDLLGIGSDNKSIVSKEDNSKNLINVLYSIGAIIILVGIATLIGQNWDLLNSFSRIFVTLGIALISYALAIVLRNHENDVLSQVMFTLSAVLAPVGTGVVLHEADVIVNSMIIFYCSFAWAIIFGYALWFTKKNILILITTIFGTIAVYALVSRLTENLISASDVFKWLTIFVGASYMLFGIHFQNSVDKQKKSIKSILYGLGTLAILGSFISYDGIFDLLMIGLVFGFFYLSIFLRSRIILILSAIFLIATIIEITVEYFANSLNWSLALIFAGILVIGTGYLTYYLNKRFISK